MKQRRALVALVLFAASAAFLGRGAWIFAKAQVAQVRAHLAEILA